LDLSYVHIYADVSIDPRIVLKEIVKIFPNFNVDIRSPFEYGGRISRAKITDLKHPFESQPKEAISMTPLYDGFELQRMFAETMPAAEADHMQIIFTSLLTCTFSEHDWRYHARAVVCGSPSIISTAGIVEAPAKPKTFYLAQLGGATEVSLKNRFAKEFIDYGDVRMTAAAVLYALQALFFFVSDGEPFCEDKDCKLYNAHWQEDLIHVIEKGKFCGRHMKVVNKFKSF
jgi:hypothetical protein